MENAIQEWIKASEYDLETAQVMADTGRYLYVTFMCQQAIEKTLKAIYCLKKNELPPRTHNLLYLVDILELSLTEPDKALLSVLNQFYLESRYPLERSKLAKEVDAAKSREYLDKTKGVWRCLKQALTQSK